MFQLKKVLLWVLVIFSCSLFAIGQKKKVVPLKVDDEPPPPVKVNKNKTTVKPEVRYSTTIEIDRNSKVRVFIESTTNLDTTDLNERFFSAFSKNSASKKLNYDEIIIKPNHSLKYAEVVKIVQKARSSTTQVESNIKPSLRIEEDVFTNIKIEISPYLIAHIPILRTKAELLNPPKPNPLTLVVKLDEYRNISLNNEAQGSISDFSQLKNLLRRVFNERMEQGIFRIGSNEVETTVRINAPRSANFSDIVKVAEALRDAGSSLIALQVDDLQP